VEGGSANDYDYTNGDPLNNRDLSGLATEHYSYPADVSSLSCEELWNWICMARKELKSRDKAFRDNVEGFGNKMSDFRYAGHVQKYQAVQGWLVGALDEYQMRCDDDRDLTKYWEPHISGMTRSGIPACRRVYGTRQQAEGFLCSVFAFLFVYDPGSSPQPEGLLPL
jgi:hypothetical protein